MCRAGGDAGLFAGAGIDPRRPADLRPALPPTLRPAGQSLRRRTGARLAGQRRPLRPVCVGRGRACHGQSGQELGSRPGPRQRLAGRAGTGLPRLEELENPLDPDHPQPRLSGPVTRRTRCAGSARRRARSTSTGSNSTTRCPSSRAASSTPRTSPPSARPMPGRSRRRNLAAGWKACCASARTRRN